VPGHLHAPGAGWDLTAMALGWYVFFWFLKSSGERKWVYLLLSQGCKMSPAAPELSSIRLNSTWSWFE
jgi:hypothetical protein